MDSLWITITRKIKLFEDKGKDMKKVKKNKIYEPTNEDIINLIHRMTGYSEDVITEYVRVAKIKNVGNLTISKIYDHKCINTLYFIQRGIKIKKIMSKFK